MDKFNKTLMIAVAAVFDTIEAFLVILGIGLLINRILTILEYLIFFVWFSFSGVNFTLKSKKISYAGGSFVSEILPGLGSLPGLTLWVFMTIRSHEEDLKEKEKNKDEVTGNKTPSNPNVTRQKRSPQDRG